MSTLGRIEKKTQQLLADLKARVLAAQVRAVLLLKREFVQRFCTSE